MTASLALTCEEVEALAGLYVLGALDDDEMAAVREHLATCDRAHAEIAELGGVVPALPALVEPVDAPAGLRDRVMAAVAATAQVAPEPATQAAHAGADGAPPVRVTPAGQPAPLAAPVGQPASSPGLAARTIPGSAPAERPVPVPPLRVVSGWRRWSRPLLAAAAIVLIVALGAWNITLQQRLDRAVGDQQALQARIDAATAQEAELRLQVDAAAARQQVLAAAIAAQADPASQVATLEGSGSAAGATGFAVFPKDKPGYMVLTGLPPVPADKTYQAWFLANGQPASAGLVPVGADEVAVLSGLQPTPGADTVALTIEKAGGVPAPTGDPVVAGSIRPVTGSRIGRAPV